MADVTITLTDWEAKSLLLLVAVAALNPSMRFNLPDEQATYEIISEKVRAAS